MPRGLPNSVAIFARSLLSPIPTEQCRPVASRHGLLNRAGERLRVLRLDTEERLVPAEHLDDDVQASAACPSPRADASSYAGASTGRNTASGHLRAAMPQRHPRADAERARLVRRRGHHATLGWVAAPADDDRSPASSGRRSTSTAAMNWSRSTCSTQAVVTTSVCPAAPPARLLLEPPIMYARASITSAGRLRVRLSSRHIHHAPNWFADTGLSSCRRQPDGDLLQRRTVDGFLHASGEQPQ